MYKFTINLVTINFSNRKFFPCLNPNAFYIQFPLKRIFLLTNSNDINNISNYNSKKLKPPQKKTMQLNDNINKYFSINNIGRPPYLQGIFPTTTDNKIHIFQ